jgi:hypothetical protein
MHTEDPYVLEAIQAGAGGIVESCGLAGMSKAAYPSV